jgi:hypothetical protein
MAALSEVQYKILAITPHVAGSVSVLASTYVLQDILRDPKKRGQIYCRLILGMAAIDFVTSLMYSMSTWPMQKGTQYAFYSLGNRGTCTMQGFFLQVEIASPIYHLFLSIYYLLILKYRWPPRKMKSYEKYMHGIALLFGMGTAIALLPLDVYGAFFVWCWIDSRDDTALYRWLFFFGPLWIIILVSSILMIQIYYHVWTEENVSRRWRNSIVDTHAKLGEKKLKKMTSRVFWQALHYEFVFYVTWTIPTIVQTILLVNGKQPGFGVLFATCFFTPLAGFFNFTIYIRPRFVRYMEDKDNSELFWWSVLLKTVKEKIPSRMLTVEIEQGEKIPKVEEKKDDSIDDDSDSDSDSDSDNSLMQNGKAMHGNVRHKTTRLMSYREDDAFILDPGTSLETCRQVDIQLKSIKLQKHSSAPVYALSERVI